MENRQFIVLGMANGGLFLARQLRKAFPESRIVGIGSRHDLGRHSRGIDRFFPADTAAELRTAVGEARAFLNEGDIQAFIASNPMLEWLTGDCPDLFTVLHFENPAELYRQFADKDGVRDLCRSCGVRQPEVYAPEAVRFPAVVKPNIKMKTLGLPKCKYVDSASSLEVFFRKTESLGLCREDVLVQQCVPGDNRWEYGYGGYFQDGKPLTDICFRQYRQLPQGLSCRAVELTGDKRESIVRFVSPLLERTRYNGFLQFDIKENAETGELFLLDINPRPWKSSDMLAVKLGKTTVFNPVPTGRKVLWRIPFADWRSEKNPNNPPRSYRPEKGGHFTRMAAVFSVGDPVPWFDSLALEVGKILKRRF